MCIFTVRESIKNQTNSKNVFTKEKKMFLPYKIEYIQEWVIVFALFWVT